MEIPILSRPIEWVCPHGCNQRDRTERADVHTRMHSCPAMGGMTVPFVDAATRVKTTVVEREDYVRSERVTTDGNGRPVMAVVTTRDDGEDRAVYAPLAIGEGSG